MNGLVILAVLVGLMFYFGYLSLRDIVRHTDGIEDYEPSIKETIVYVVLNYMLFHNKRK